MEMIARAWKYYTPNERFSFFIAFLWLSLITIFGMGEGEADNAWLQLSIIILVVLGFSALGTIVALFAGGGGFEKRWRRMVDRFLPITTLFGIFYFLTLLNNSS